MNITSTINGIDAVFGARWDDEKSKARHQTRFRNTVGYYDDKDVSTKAHPAPSIAFKLLDDPSEQAVINLFYHDDAGQTFGSIILSAGLVSPLSEVIYSTPGDWERAIEDALNDQSIDHVYAPDGSIIHASEKFASFSMKKDMKPEDLPKISSGFSIKTALIVAGMLVVLSAIPIGAWVYVAEPFKKAEEIKFVIEKIKPDFTTVLDACAVDLEEPWPSPPEWNLAQEGCVMAPELTRISFPKPEDQRPYAYRFYDLDDKKWDPFLSRAAFLKMAESFPGQILEGTNQVVLYMPYDIDKNPVADSYVPDIDPQKILRENFVGIMEISGSVSAAGLTATTNLELDKVIERISDKRLTPSHIFRNLDNDSTGLSVSAERIETRQVRVE